MKLHKIIYTTSLLTLITCSNYALGAETVLKGTLECSSQKDVSCELSSANIVKFSGKKYLISNSDKETSLYLWSLDSFQKKDSKFKDKIKADKIIPLPEKAKVQKIESIATVNDWVIITGAYSDNFKEKNNRDANRHIFAFKFDDKGEIGSIVTLGSPDLLKILFETARKGDGNGKGPLPGHIEFEASAVIPDQLGSYKFIMGLRQYGKSGLDYKHVVRFFETTIDIKKDSISLGKKWNQFMDMKKMPGYGIGDMFYDGSSKSIQVMTTYEDEKKGNNGAMWTIGVQDFLKGKDTFKKVPLNIFKNHKPEGIASFDKKTIVLADEDRSTPVLGNGRKRESNEAPFWIFEGVK
jgi:hypothetical protein